MDAGYSKGSIPQWRCGYMKVCRQQTKEVLKPIHSTTALVNNCGEGSGLSQNLEFCFKQSALLILKANTQLLWNRNNKFLTMWACGRVTWGSCVCVSYPTHSSYKDWLSKILWLWRGVRLRVKIISGFLRLFVQEVTF